MKSGRLFICLLLASSLSGCAWLGLSGGPEPTDNATQAASIQAASTQAASTQAAAAPAQTPAPAPEKAPAQTPAPAKQAAPAAAKTETAKPEPAKPAAPVAQKVAKGDVLYPTVDDLLAAAKEAETKGTIAGDIAAFDAFPHLPGPDTAGRAFRTGKQGELTVKLFAFHAPGKPYDRRVYGYLVDGGDGKFFGHFDTDADGVFDAHTLEPHMQFDKFEKLQAPAKKK